jgi:predicted ATPase/DNA-binding CsgD family transcriptional regulator
VDERASPTSTSDEPGAGRASTSRKTGLPRPLSSFVGREGEIASVTAPLTEGATRLLTLTGPGGVGKTRLAIQVASHLPDGAYPDGIRYISLSLTHDASSVPATIARGLGIHQYRTSARDAIVEELESIRCLLILDNFEQVLAAAPLVADLLASCPNISVLATSRAILDVAGEQVFEVSPLALPSTSANQSVDSIGMSDAERLFRQRARERGLHLDFDATSVQEIAKICLLLDGLPLAIELAVPWVRIISTSELLARLNHRLPLLASGPRDAPDRHRTMRATIEWSHALLTPEDQALFRRCAVFVGGFPIDAVHAVVGIDTTAEALLSGLGHLVDHSLIRRVPVTPGHPASSPPRLVLLETIREYAWERLLEAGEEAETRSRHAAWCLALAEDAVRVRIGLDVDTLPGTDRLAVERHNARAACEWHLSQGAITGAMTLACTLWPLWLEHGEVGEGRTYLKRLLSYPADTMSPELSARAKVVLGQLAQAQGDRAEAERVIREALPTLEALRDDRSLGVAYTTLGLVELVRGNYHEAARLLERSLDRFRAVGDLRAGSWSLRHLSSVALGQGGIDQYERLARQGVELVGDAGSPLDLARLGTNLAQAAAIRGRLEDATSQFEVVLDRYRQAGDRWGEADALQRLGVIAYLKDLPDRANELLVQSERLFRKIGDPEGMCRVLTAYGWLARKSGDLELAASRFDDVVSIARQHDARDSLARALMGRGVIYLDSGDAWHASQLWGESLALLTALDDRITRITLLEWIAHLGRGGHPVEAARLLGACAAMRQATGIPMDSASEPEHESLRRAVQLDAGEHEFHRAFSAGERATQAETIRTAEGLLERAASAPSSGSTLETRRNLRANGVLTHREIEILRLLVAGMSDAEMAHALGISRRTVATHISHIYDKIGVSSRAAAAAWGVRHEVS